MSDIEDKESLEGKLRNLYIGDKRRVTRSASKLYKAPNYNEQYKVPQLTQIKRSNTKNVKKTPKYIVKDSYKDGIKSQENSDDYSIDDIKLELSHGKVIDENIYSKDIIAVKDVDRSFSDSELSNQPSLTKIKRRNTKLYKKSHKKDLNVGDKCEDIKVYNAEILNENFLIKKDLDLTSASDVVGRNNEIEKIKSFIDDKLDKNENGNIYISGVPGTGKTMVVTKLIESYVKTINVRYYFINCMSFGVGNAIFHQISSLLNITNKGLHNIEDYFNKKHSRPICIVLDEIDQLVSRDNGKLYRIFNWSEISQTPLIIIGISNSLSLTERNLPYLKLNKHTPYHINFPAYSSKELQDIILARLDSHKSTAKIDRAAIHFCCSKVAAKTGDARNALSLFTEAANIQNTETDIVMESDSEEVDKENRFESPKKEQILTKTPLNTPLLLARKMSSRIAMPSSPSVKHVQRAILKLEQVTDPFQTLNPFDDSENSSEQLPLQHKLVLCSALSLREKLQKQIQRTKSFCKSKSKSALTVEKVYDHYCFITMELGLPVLSQSEILSICDLLDASCLAKLGPMGKDFKSTGRSFTLPLDIEGVRKALGDQELLGRVMDLCDS